MDDIKIFAKKDKELKILLISIRIYCQDIGIEFPIEKFAMFIIRKKSIKHRNNRRNIAQSAGAVEYTDCTAAEGYPPHNECSG